MGQGVRRQYPGNDVLLQVGGEANDQTGARAVN